MKPMRLSNGAFALIAMATAAALLPLAACGSNGGDGVADGDDGDGEGLLGGEGVGVFRVFRVFRSNVFHCVTLTLGLG